MAAAAIKSLRKRLDRLNATVDAHTVSRLDALPPSQLSRYRAWQQACDVVVAAAAATLVEAGWPANATDLQYAALLTCEPSMPPMPGDIAAVLGVALTDDLDDEQVAEHYRELVRSCP